MIKVALPTKGMLFEPTQELLKDCGYKASKPYKTLTQLDSKNGIEFFFLRPSDIPMYVGRGIIDAGITGIDFNAEAKSPAVKVLDLPYGASKMCAAVPNESPVQSLDDLKNATIATSFPNIVSNYYKKDMKISFTGLRTGKKHTRSCFVYIMHEDRPLGVPTHRYMATCYEGYDDFGFDTNCLKKAFYDSLEGAQ